jgi:hypothetical protein
MRRGRLTRSLLCTHIRVDSPAGLLDLPAVGLRSAVTIHCLRSAATIQTQCVRVCEGCGCVGEGGGRAIAATYNQKPRSHRGSALRPG